MLVFYVFMILVMLALIFIMLTPFVVVAHVTLSLLKQRSYLAYGLSGVVSGPLALGLHVTGISLFSAPLVVLLASAVLGGATMLFFRFLMRTSTEKPDYWFCAPFGRKTGNPTP